MVYTIIICAVFSSNNALSCDESYISFMYKIIEEKKDELDCVVPKLMPNSIIIAQAIQESGYGKSKASKNKNNHFGLMSKGKIISFDSIEENVIFYLKNLNSHKAYNKLREKLQKGEKNIYNILNSFYNYSKDEKYSKKIISIIKQCNLERYDGLNDLKDL